MGIVARPVSFPLDLTVGCDHTLTFTVTEGGVPYSWTGATVTTKIVDSTGTESAVDFTVTAAIDGTLVLALTDANTTALGTGVFSYLVAVMKSGLTTPWFGGRLEIWADSTGAGSTNATGTIEVTTTTATIEISGGITGASGSGSTSLIVQESDTTRVATVGTIDFGAQFNVTESPANEANVSLDMAVVAADAELAARYAPLGDGAAEVAAHEAEANPHPGYLTPAEGDAAYDALGAAAIATSTAASALASHEADTTNVHGIANTANLETTSGAQTKATAAQTAAEATAAAALATHTADTTAVHGITDTAKVVQSADSTVLQVIKLTQAAYDALTPVATTLYVIVG